MRPNPSTGTASRVRRSLISWHRATCDCRSRLLTRRRQPAAACWRIHMHTVSREVVDRLKESGVDRIFGIPGSNASIELIREASQSGVQFVPTGHESAAAIAAGTYGAMTDSVGACLSIMGPGALNVNSGLLHCAYERTPVLALTERYGDEVLGHVQLQKIDHGELFRPVTKSTGTLTASNCGDLIKESLETARAERPGPVHLDFPHDVCLLETEQRPGVAAQTDGRPNPEMVEKAKGLLAAAKRPVLVVGSLALRENLGSHLSDLSERFSLPILVSVKGKSVIDETSSWYAGPYLGVGKAELIENRILEQADLVIAIGIDGCEIVMPAGREVDAIAIDKVETDVANIYTRITPLIGSPGESIAELATAGSASVWRPEEVAQITRDWLDHVRSFDTDDSVQAVIRATRELMDDEDVFVCDIGLYSKLVEQLWVSRRPETFHISLAARNMGSALPMAIGASLARPDRNTVCFIGDGGLLMHMPELNVVAQEGLPLTIVLFVDGGWGTIRVFQRKKYYEIEGTNFHQPNWGGLSEHIGFESKHADTEGAYRQHLDWALERRRPSLITVSYDAVEYDKILGMVR
ncbi:MAG: hypothetical protein CME19_18375 [Gemmatimonadetes bacterium]|nr:hypothetical protein [Gemmatimonadota bacterium]